MSAEDDRNAIRELAWRYARAADRRDYAAFRDLFAPEARLAGYRAPDQRELLYEMRGHDAICEAMRNLERYDTTFHFVGNHLVERDGDDPAAARGEVYCVAHHLYDEGGERMNYTMFIRYQDEYRRGPSGWRFQDRVLILDFRERRPLAGTPDP